MIMIFPLRRPVMSGVVVAKSSACKCSVVQAFGVQVSACRWPFHAAGGGRDDSGARVLDDLRGSVIVRSARHFDYVPGRGGASLVVARPAAVWSGFFSLILLGPRDGPRLVRAFDQRLAIGDGDLGGGNSRLVTECGLPLKARKSWRCRRTYQ